MGTPKRARGHTDREEAQMAVHVTALTEPVADLIDEILRKHHRAILEAVKELHERAAKAEALLRRIEPYIDSIICYASTVSDYEGNRLAVDFKAHVAALAAQENESGK